MLLKSETETLACLREHGIQTAGPEHLADGQEVELVERCAAYHPMGPTWSLGTGCFHP